MDNYEKLREIGKGSYGVVWLVKHKKDKKNYVLKRIDLRKTSERDKLSAQQEAQLLKSLKHPNIVSYKESFQVDGFLHIVMLYCDGGDLYTKIKEQNGKYLEETQIVEWFVQIAMALQYMHENNILHRDLKTQNIFLTKNKIIKVGDLGIARVLKGNNDMATTIIGTPYYMSPELFSNKPYNSKSDVWALGCCVYEMTTLKHAFNAKDMTSLVFKITKGKMPPIPSHYSRDLIVLIESMLNSDPKKRPTVNRILRDPYIKKNIMLFLERTKKIQQQIEKDSKMNKASSQVEPEKEKSSRNVEIIRTESASPLVKVPEPRLPRNQSDSAVRYDNGEYGRQYSPENKLNSPSPQNVQIINSNNEKNESDNNYVSSSPNKSTRPGARVRISTVVEDIETREHYTLNHSLKSESESDFNIDNSKQDNKKSIINNVQEPSSDNNNNVSKPRIFSIAPKRSPIFEEQINNDKQKLNNNIPTSSENVPNQILSQPVLNARERRRQRLRLSQNDSNPDSKPPILRRYNVHQSDGFISNEKSNLLPGYESPFNNNKREIIKKEQKPSNHDLQDSLKIIKNSQLQNPISNEQTNIKNLANKLEKNPFLSNNKKKQIESSSSSSSIASSNDENDPGKELIRFEKKKIKEKKEMDNFIMQLNSTLNAANLSRNESEVEDLKDEIFDDLEEEALQAEEEKYNSEINNNNNNNNKPKKPTFYSNSKEDQSESDDDDDDENIIVSRPSRPNQPQINTLGATNHMHNRIFSLENEFIQLIGRKKLEDAFKVLDSFKEDEIESKLIALMGRQLYEANSAKLWLLKFCKDTAKISMRN